MENRIDWLKKWSRRDF